MGLLWLAALAPLTSAVAQTGRVEGTVVNLQTGEPVPEARVIIEGTRWFGLTDRHGSYSILDVPIGLYNVRVEAVGFELAVHLNHRILAYDRRTAAVQPTRLDIELRPWRFPTERPPERPARAVAVQPGIGLGVSHGIQGLAGAANRLVEPGQCTDLFVRYGTSFGLALHAGGHFGGVGISSVPRGAGVNGFYVEPRFVMLNISSRWAPFVAAQVALAREAIQSDRAEFAAPGRFFGVGVGAVYRIATQITLEGGLSAGAASFGDYVFRGDLASYRCLEEVEQGTPLPESAALCGAVVSFLPKYTCYPPFSERLGGDCDLPEIHRGGSGRSGAWYQLRVGFQVGLGNIR